MRLVTWSNMYFNASPEIFRRAKELRDHMTASEQHLWSYLSNKKLEGLRFKPQHPIDQFIVDFYCHKVKLVIEIDGEIHLYEEQAERDTGRTAELENLGLTVIRFTNQDLGATRREVSQIMTKFIVNDQRNRLKTDKLIRYYSIVGQFDAYKIKKNRRNAETQRLFFSSSLRLRGKKSCLKNLRQREIDRS